MPISYHNAVSAISVKASQMALEFHDEAESVPIEEAVGRVARHEYRTPYATPPFDTSAMDGYAVSSSLLQIASKSDPVTMKIMGTIAAGDDEMRFQNEVDCYVPCVEIMTGARFPFATTGSAFDACIPVESVLVTEDRDSGGRQLVSVKEPVRANQHKRFAASDFKKDQVIIASNRVITDRHVMALASVGVERVAVKRKLRIGLWSTGRELRQDRADSRIHDVNGPYLMSVLKSRGVDAEFLGTLADDPIEMARSFRSSLSQRKFDILMTTGGVSAGKFDFVRDTLEGLKASIHFHGVAMRPGHPVLFATFSQHASSAKSEGIELQRSADTAYFGLPGNPVAAAVCFEFLVMPYMSHYGLRFPRETSWARLREVEKSDGIRSRKPSDNDEFRHGVLVESEIGLECSISEDQSPAKTRPLLESDCFVHIPPNTASGQYVLCYPFGSSFGKPGG